MFVVVVVVVVVVGVVVDVVVIVFVVLVVAVAVVGIGVVFTRNSRLAPSFPGLLTASREGSEVSVDSSRMFQRSGGSPR